MRKLLFSTFTTGPITLHIGLLLLRLAAGLSLALAHGRNKFPVPDQMIEGVKQLGFPLPTLFAWAAALSELAGGILLALGLLGRPAALMIVITMSVAAFMAHADDPFAKKELAVLYLSISAALLLTGPGKLSADALINRPPPQGRGFSPILRESH